jgi:urease accessory protein
MLTLAKVLPRAQGLAPVLLRRAATVELDWDVRQKSRFETTDSQGRQLGVFLPRGTVLRGGDVLVAEDGSLVRVIAAPQPVLVVTACPTHGSPFDLTRAAYHLGNRHVPLELQPDRLQFEPDHVLADMLRAMHLIVTPADAPFEPESGAYAAGATGHGHEHGHGAHEHAHAQHHDHDHDHGQASSHAAAGRDAHGHDHGAPGAAPALGARPAVAPVTLHRHDPRGATPAPKPAAAGHVHGPGCHHDHDHDHGHGHGHDHTPSRKP